MRTGIADLPLHYGRAPRWLFERMVKLAGAIIELIAIELGTNEVLKRLSDPFWFQSFGSLLGFDWHSSGLTTTTLGSIKEALKNRDIGIFVAGGKGKTSRKTPKEITEYGEKYGFDPGKIIYSSRMTAKVDSSAIQDGYQIYHHVIIFTKDGNWAVIQQGMNTTSRYARRYHWASDSLKSFVIEPHTGIISRKKEQIVLDLTSKKSIETQKVIIDLTREPPEKLTQEIEKIRYLKLPPRHELLIHDINPKHLNKIFSHIYENSPENFEELLSLRGVGPKSLRALALISDIVYGARPSYTDPAIYAYAHGGKDGYPYPVNRRVYDRSIDVIEKAIKISKIGNKEKLFALRKLNSLFTPEEVRQ